LRNSAETPSSRRETVNESDSEGFPNNPRSAPELEHAPSTIDGSNKVDDRLSLVLMSAGFAVVILGTSGLAPLGVVRYESVLLSFGVLVFISGITLCSWDRKLQGTYITYMWIAAFIILASITGISAIGTLIKP
jgi:hypothetical protein